MEPHGAPRKERVNSPSIEDATVSILEMERKKRIRLVRAVASAIFFIFCAVQYDLKLPDTLTILKDDDANEPEGMNTILPPCSALNIDDAKEGMICLPQCEPNPNETVEGLGLNLSEKITLRAQITPSYGVDHDFGKYRYYFPEEEIYLNQARSYGEHLQPTAYRERLFRRIVAKLYRAGVLDSSKNIVNSGSNIGDNALPWARMLDQLASNSSKSPGKVYAIDPSKDYLTSMVNIANENSISNLCTHISLIGAEDNNGVAKLDSMGIENLGFLHLDVEGHEGEALLGAVGLINQHRPVVSSFCLLWS